jgi:hypothetical protein
VDQTSEPAKLPENYRYRTPDGPRKIRDMQEGEGGVTTLEAIWVDANWGVWIDLNAPIFGRPAQLGEETPVGIMKYPEGYSVTLSHAAAKFKKRWIPSMLESPPSQDFERANHIN